MGPSEQELGTQGGWRGHQSLAGSPVGILFKYGRKSLEDFKPGRQHLICLLKRFLGGLFSWGSKVSFPHTHTLSLVSYIQRD